jgi:phosphoglycolate phosphatase
MLKLIVFDWDGTLADSVSKITECKQFLANKYGLPVPSEDTVRHVLGKKFEEALSICFPYANTELLNKLGDEFHYLMRQKHYQAALFPHAKEILSTLKTRDLKLAIATAKDRSEFNNALLHNELAGIFDITCCAKEYPSKPNPTILHYLMETFNVTPDECLMIGDTTNDVLFATNANVKSICVTFGAHSKKMLQSLNPLAFIDEWKQFTEVIDRLCYTMRQYYPLLLQV